MQLFGRNFALLEIYILLINIQHNGIVLILFLILTKLLNYTFVVERQLRVCIKILTLGIIIFIDFIELK